MMLAACDVEPLASGVEKVVVDLPRGRLLMNGEMFTFSMLRPSSALIYTHSGSIENTHTRARAHTHTHAHTTHKTRWRARTVTASGSHTTNSRPSPGILL